MSLPTEETGRLNSSRAILAEIVRRFLSCWKDLALTDIAYKIVAFVLLTPLVGIPFRVLVAFSGRSVLADQDILFFFLGPVGWVCFVGIGALLLAILALEQAALVGIIGATSQARRLRVIGALRFAAAHGGPVLRVTVRMLAWILLTAAPFVAIAGLAYVTLLGQYDINYYLTDKPSEFLIAVGLGAILLVALFAVLLGLATGWFYALPIVLFEDVAPRDALRVSRQRASGHRRKLLFWILAWFIATSLVSAVATGLVGGVGRIIVPAVTGSLGLLLFNVGGIVLLWSAVNLICNLFSTTSFAAILFDLYQRSGSTKAIDVSAFTSAEVTGTAGFELTRKRIAVASIAGIIVALAVGAVTIHSVGLPDRTQITAHRGASASAPENTLAAIEEAIQQDTDWVEIDVQETADGEVVVLHDSDFKKLAGNPLKIWDATMADLERIDIGSRFAPEFAGQRVPTLSQVLDTCKGKVRVNIELKYYGHDDRLEQRVVDLVEKHGMESDVMIMSLKSAAVVKMKSLRPAWKVGLLTSVKLGDLTRSKADFLAVNAKLASRGFIRSAHSSGKEVHVWTVNDALSMSTMIGRGVDNIITDKPGLGKTVLKERAALSVPERLLLELAGILGVESEIGEQ